MRIRTDPWSTGTPCSGLGSVIQDYISVDPGPPKYLRIRNTGTYTWCLFSCITRHVSSSIADGNQSSKKSVVSYRILDVRTRVLPKACTSWNAFPQCTLVETRLHYYIAGTDLSSKRSHRISSSLVYCRTVHSIFGWVRLLCSIFLSPSTTISPSITISPRTINIDKDVVFKHVYFVYKYVSLRNETDSNFKGAQVWDFDVLDFYDFFIIKSI